MLTDQTLEKEYCPRESALCYGHDLDPGWRWINTATRLTFDMGWFLQHSVTENLLKYAVGDWHCKVCDKTWRGGAGLCSCGAAPTYQEMHFRSPISGVTGSLDLVLHLGHTKPVIIEIKSLEKDAFKELAMPTIDHRLRVVGYLHLLRECAETDLWISENIELEFGYVLYVSKGFGKYFPKKEGGVNEKFSPFQEYAIKAEGNPLNTVKEKFDRALEYWKWRGDAGEHLEGKPLPARIFNCGHKECKRANKCPAQAKCWEGDKV